MSTASEINTMIREKALSVGFSRIGFTNPVLAETTRSFYSRFVEEHGYAGMHYLRRYAPERTDPGKLLPGVKTIIAVLLNYYPQIRIPEEDNFIISKYAYGEDHHIILKQRLQQLTSFMAAEWPGCTTRTFFDSGPVLEKMWAQRCGIGWQGKNTLLITKKGGSFFFIGIIFTDLESAPDAPETDHCGTCDRCLKACPTGALEKPYQLNISRCIAYQTIENKKQIPEEIRGKLKDRIFGCDICQDVCPYNRFAEPHRVPEFNPSPELVHRRKKEWLEFGEPDFNRIFRRTALSRTGYSALKRNILMGSCPAQADSPHRKAGK